MNFLVNKNIKRALAEIRSFIPGAPFRSGARILMYHSIGGRPEDHPLAVRVPTDKFEKELLELAESDYKTVAVSEVIENIKAIDNNRFIAITFDDGYKDNIVAAAPLLKKFGLKATFFISTSYIDEKSQKRWADGEMREYMRWEDIARLEEMGFEIGSHMVHHTNLTALSDADLCLEFKSSRDIISRHIGCPVKIFSYPYGKVDRRVIETARDTGYIGGCSSFSGYNNSNINKYILRRTEIDGYDTIRNFRHKISGFYD